MNRIRTLLENKSKRKLLVPFFTAGYPDIKTTIELVRASVDVGADIVEIGVPFSDPVADGPAIQFSSQIALKNGMNLRRILSTVHQLRKSVQVPIVLMGYFNPILAFGISSFLKSAVDSGVDGLIIPDLPVEEAESFSSLARKHEIGLIFLSAPTSGEKRVKLIDKLSDDMVYAVTVTGVTGSRGNVATATDSYLRSLKKQLTKPFVAGFGVSTPETAKRLAKHAHGVVIGSALIDIMRNAQNHSDGVNKTARLLSRIRRALDNNE